MLLDRFWIGEFIFPWIRITRKHLANKIFVPQTFGQMGKWFIFLPHEMDSSVKGAGVILGLIPFSAMLIRTFAFHQ